MKTFFVFCWVGSIALLIFFGGLTLQRCIDEHNKEVNKLYQVKEVTKLPVKATPYVVEVLSYKDTTTGKSYLIFLNNDDLFVIEQKKEEVK